MLLTGVIIGKIFDDHGPRLLLLVGAFLEVFGLMMTSISTQYYQILLSQAVCSAIGAAMVFYPSFSCVSGILNWRAMATATAKTRDCRRRPGS
jgi:nitrate/nitrite transporter NarK